MDNLKRDRFELLSAYLDGEVTADERRQVDQWLKDDPVVQQLYGRLLRLRQGVKGLPVPSEQSVEAAVQQVFGRIRRRYQHLFAWGSVAVAAVCVGALFGDMGVGRYSPQMVQDPQEPLPSEALMIALDHPIIEIPKAPLSEPANFPEESLGSAEGIQ